MKGFLKVVGGGIKGLVKRSVASATGGRIAGGGGATALAYTDEITAIIAGVTALAGVVGNLLREYYTYKKSL